MTLYISTRGSFNQNSNGSWYNAAWVDLGNIWVHYPQIPGLPDPASVPEATKMDNSQYQTDALIKQLNDEAAAKIAYDAQVAAQTAAVNAAKQLQLKSEMLQSNTAVFSTPETYAKLLNDTNAQITQWNASINEMNNLNNPAVTTNKTLVDAGAGMGLGGDYNKTIVDTATNDQPSTDQAPQQTIANNKSWALLMLPVILLIVVILYIMKGGRS